jgi:hypothetical protein
MSTDMQDIGASRTYYIISRRFLSTLRTFRSFPECLGELQEYLGASGSAGVADRSLCEVYV